MLIVTADLDVFFGRFNRLSNLMTLTAFSFSISSLTQITSTQCQIGARADHFPCLAAHYIFEHLGKKCQFRKPQPNCPRETPHTLASDKCALALTLVAPAGTFYYIPLRSSRRYHERGNSPNQNSQAKIRGENFDLLKCLLPANSII